VPRAALLLKVDTLGDLVVFAPVLRRLRTEWPDTRLVALIRRAYVDLAPLLAPGVEWLATHLDPFAQGPEADAAEVARLRDAVTALQPDLVAAATSRRNWLEAALAAAVPSARRVALGTSADDEFFATRLRVALGIDATHVFAEQVPVPTDEADWSANFRLADALLGRAVERTPPVLTLDPKDRESVADVLAGHGLEPGRYVVCAAAGFANVRLKTWPAERFAACLREIHARHGLRALVVGHESERAHLEPLVASAAGSPSAPALWLGQEGSLPQLAALIAPAALYLGNDTGAMHLAAALDVPVVAIFGGGTWPRFVPAARRGAAVVQPLPCFGCGWDCAFGDAPCLGGITVDDVLPAIAHALGGAAFRIQTVEHLAAETRAMMGRAATRHRESSAGHLARQHKLEELTALSREKDGEIAALKTVCDEREKTIFILDGHVRNFQTENGAIKADLAVKERTLASLPHDAAKAAQTIADLVVHTRNIEALLRHREGELAEQKLSAANLVAGHHDLERAKHYGRELARRDTTIEALHEGLAARDKTIAQLSAEATGFTAALRKLWLGAASRLRERCGRPFSTWLFQSVVERYWMQIGVLRHYDPRALRWDERLPRAETRRRRAAAGRHRDAELQPGRLRRTHDPQHRRPAVSATRIRRAGRRLEGPEPRDHRPLRPLPPLLGVDAGPRSGRRDPPRFHPTRAHARARRAHGVAEFRRPDRPRRAALRGRIFCDPSRSRCALRPPDHHRRQRPRGRPLDHAAPPSGDVGVDRLRAARDDVLAQARVGSGGRHRPEFSVRPRLGPARAFPASRLPDGARAVFSRRIPRARGAEDVAGDPHHRRGGDAPHPHAVSRGAAGRFRNHPPPRAPRPLLGRDHGPAPRGRH
jgi:ADP-heptose:LPS heptosyltransferase